jgi:hypothetical protein
VTPSWKLAPWPRSKHEKRTAGSTWETRTVVAADGVHFACVRWEINCTIPLCIPCICVLTNFYSLYTRETPGTYKCADISRTSLTQRYVRLTSRDVHKFPTVPNCQPLRSLQCLCRNQFWRLLSKWGWPSYRRNGRLLRNVRATWFAGAGKEIQGMQWWLCSSFHRNYCFFPFVVSCIAIHKAHKRPTTCNTSILVLLQDHSTTFRALFAPIIRNTINCSLLPLVQHMSLNVVSVAGLIR